MKIRPWRIVRSEPGPELTLFRARFDTALHPRTGREKRRLVLETEDWCNIVAITPDERVVLVRQYRSGIHEVTLEIPGGSVDPGESHEAAAKRELREETGYTASDWRYLGRSAPNPAVQDNHLHTWLATGAEATHSLDLGDGEEIEVVTLSLDELRRAIADGEIQHSLGLVGLARAFDLRA